MSRDKQWDHPQTYRRIYRLDAYTCNYGQYRVKVTVSLWADGKFIADGFGWDDEEAISQAKWWVDELEKRRPKS